MSRHFKLVKLELGAHKKDIESARQNIFALRFIEENIPTENGFIVAEIEEANCAYHLRKASDSAGFCIEIVGTTRRRKAVTGIIKNRLIRLQRDVNGARLP